VDVANFFSTCRIWDDVPERSIDGYLCACELTNERDVDVDPWLGVPDGGRTDGDVVCHLATP